MREDPIAPSHTQRTASDLLRSFRGKSGIAVQLVGLLLILYLGSLYNFLLFHSMAEMFSILIACCVFLLAWNTRRIIDNSYLVFISIAFLHVGVLDAFHTLAYKGMGVFQGFDSNQPTQLWIAARYMQSMSLLIAPFFLRRRLRAVPTYLVYAILTILTLLVILEWGFFPDCYIEGIGLTPFKKFSEYLISVILLAAAFLLNRNRNEFDRDVLDCLVMSVVATIGAELAFTFYIDVYDLSILIGHFFKIVAFYFVYRAIIVTGMTKPYNLLFRELKRNEEALEEAHHVLALRVEELEHTKRELENSQDDLESRVKERAEDLYQATDKLQTEILVREQAEGHVKQQLDRLKALRQVDLAITSSLDPRVIFQVLLDQVTSQLNADAATVLVFDKEERALRFVSGRGFRTEALQHTYLRLGEGFAGQAALERKIVSIPNLAEAESDLYRSPRLKDEDFVSYFAVPLIAKGVIQGVLEIFNRTFLNPDQEWFDFLEAVAGQAAIAIDNTTLFDELNQSNIDLMQAYDTTLEGWVGALDLRDEETEGHTQRVTESTVKLARAMGISGEELVHVRRGALLHDIGKIAVPDTILLKPGPLTDEEWEVMRKHPSNAYKLLSPIEFLRPALDIPYCHHEKWDGTGYPRGLKEKEIPLAARIFAVVDVWDALRSDRPYRKAWPEGKVLDHLREERETHFDPKVVDRFLDIQKVVVPEGVPAGMGEMYPDVV